MNNFLYSLNLFGPAILFCLFWIGVFVLLVLAWDFVKAKNSFKLLVKKIKELM